MAKHKQPEPTGDDLPDFDDLGGAEEESAPAPSRRALPSGKMDDALSKLPPGPGTGRGVSGSAAATGRPPPMDHKNYPTTLYHATAPALTVRSPGEWEAAYGRGYRDLPEFPPAERKAIHRRAQRLA